MTSNLRSYRCFFCDEEFSGVDATNHFGRDQSAEPACKIKAAGEFALLQALRNAEDTLSRHRADDSDTQRAMHSMIADHIAALRREEEKGYARGLKDAQHVETSPPHASDCARHNAPALPAGECDCGADSEASGDSRELLEWRASKAIELMEGHAFQSAAGALGGTYDFEYRAEKSTVARAIRCDVHGIDLAFDGDKCWECEQGVAR